MVQLDTVQLLLQLSRATYLNRVLAVNYTRETFRSHHHKNVYIQLKCHLNQYGI